jgi:C2H2 type zinc finger protein
MDLRTECPHCQKMLSDTKNLKKHIEIVHEKNKNHFCAFCSKGFYDKGHLNIYTKRSTWGRNTWPNVHNRDVPLYFNLQQ